MRRLILKIILLCLLSGGTVSAQRLPGVLNAAFLCVEGVYNSELMAPFDILQHSIYRDSVNYIRCFIVTPDGRPFTTSEGIHITPDYNVNNCPAVDILVIPSTETSMDVDLENPAYMQAVRRFADQAHFVMTLCDGAFPLAHSGLLDGHIVTTFPGDRDTLRERYPALDVRYDVNFVVDGKMVTSVGGALSYQPALYLLERIYSRTHAHRTGLGLVLDWNPEQIPHLVVDKKESTK